MAGMKGRSGGARRNAGRPPLTAHQRWLRGAGPRPLPVGGPSPPVPVPEMSASEPGALPAHWRVSTREWFLRVLEDWEFSPSGERLLQHAAECLDIAEAAREQIARDGLLVPGVGGTTRAHPLLQIAANRGARF